MADSLALELTDKGLLTDQVTLSIHYDAENMNRSYQGPVTKDFYGREVPKPSHGSASLGKLTASGRIIANTIDELFEKIAVRELTIRHIYVVLNHTVPFTEAHTEPETYQPLLIPELNENEKTDDSDEIRKNKELDLQRSILRIQKKFGRNALLKGMSLQDQATQKERNDQVGGHKS